MDTDGARHPEEIAEIEETLSHAVELLSAYRFDHAVEDSQVDGVIERATRLLNP